LYEKWNKEKKIIEVIMVSGDRDESGFNQTIADLPYLSIPFNETETRTPSINKMIPCTGYPTPGIINAQTGAVLKADAFDDNWDENLINEYLSQC
jgi:hypothetical protein